MHKIINNYTQACWWIGALLCANLTACSSDSTIQEEDVYDNHTPMAFGSSLSSSEPAFTRGVTSLEADFKVGTWKNFNQSGEQQVMDGYKVDYTADATPYRFYSMSTQIALARKEYYDILEQTQKGTLDITAWLLWFLGRMDVAIKVAMETIERTLSKATFWESHRHVAMNERQTKMVNMLWDGFEGKLTSSKWAKINKCSPDTALRDLQDLVAKGILARTESGGRSTGYDLVK